MLIAAEKLVSADIFVFARAMEDTVDLMLTRSRVQSELATMMTNINMLNELADTWAKSRDSKLLHCALSTSDNLLLIQNFAYTRGTATVSPVSTSFFVAL